MWLHCQLSHCYVVILSHCYIVLVFAGLVLLLFRNRPGGGVACLEKYLHFMGGGLTLRMSRTKQISKDLPVMSAELHLVNKIDLMYTSRFNYSLVILGNSGLKSMLRLSKKL